MEIENILAKNITAAGEKAAYDAACKRLLANKVILAWIMKSCMEENKPHSIKEIAERYIEGIPQIAEAAVNPDEDDMRAVNRSGERRTRTVRYRKERSLMISVFWQSFREPERRSA